MPGWASRMSLQMGSPGRSAGLVGSGLRGGIYSMVPLHSRGLGRMWGCLRRGRRYRLRCCAGLWWGIGAFRGRISGHRSGRGCGGRGCGGRGYNG